jgi:Amidohydrolase ring-opening protein (Amido_AtzD_TrzD)
MPGARGKRTTLLDDADSAKTAKAVGGALIGSVIGRTAFFLSGGETRTKGRRAAARLQH